MTVITFSNVFIDLVFLVRYVVSFCLLGQLGGGNISLQTGFVKGTLSGPGELKIF